MHPIKIAVSPFKNPNLRQKSYFDEILDRSTLFNVILDKYFKVCEDKFDFSPILYYDVHFLSFSTSKINN